MEWSNNIDFTLCSFTAPSQPYCVYIGITGMLCATVSTIIDMVPHTFQLQDLLHVAKTQPCTHFSFVFPHNVLFAQWTRSLVHQPAINASLVEAMPGGSQQQMWSVHPVHIRYTVSLIVGQIIQMCALDTPVSNYCKWIHNDWLLVEQELKMHVPIHCCWLPLGTFMVICT